LQKSSRNSETPPPLDLHTHGLDRIHGPIVRAEDIRGLARLHGAAGTGGFLVTLYPAPLRDLRRAAELIAREMERPPAPHEAVILGVHMEGPFLNPRRAGALDPSAFFSPGKGDADRLLDGLGQVIRVITVAPEIPGAVDFIGSAAERGVRVNMGHTNAGWREAREGHRAGARGITHLWNAMPGLHHREPGIIGYALSTDDLYVELIADGYHVAPAVVDLTFRIKPPDRVILVSDSVGGGRPGGGPVRNSAGKLMGGGAALPEIVERLAERGYGRQALALAAHDNPRRYLDLNVAKDYR